ncbi:HlyU family transcriptional regulator [uncultured Amphritea sp.]|uniref:HlyU family transcriptional regulator n=1 Tax=Amphritea sp. TaxID=1872502 RepID=UPI0025E2B3B8|nr:HlyU family transcriptional regulator [uncultured Amphritea sp.]
MSLLSALKSLFAPLPEGAIRYKGYTILATPEEDGGVFRLSGVITKRNRQKKFTLVDQVSDKELSVKRWQAYAKTFIDQKHQNALV